MHFVGIGSVTVSQLGEQVIIASSPVETGLADSLCYYSADGNKVSDTDGLLAFSKENNAFNIRCSTNLHKPTTFNDDLIVKKNAIFSGLVNVFQQGAFFNKRVKVDGKLNLRKTTITSSKGSSTDSIGDVAIDSKYLCYCHTKYDGETDIWVRWAITDTSWEDAQ